MQGDIGFDDHASLALPAACTVEAFAKAGDEVCTGFQGFSKRCHQRLGKTLQHRVFPHAHHVFKAFGLEEVIQFGTGEAGIKADANLRFSKRFAQPR